MSPDNTELTVAERDAATARLRIGRNVWVGGVPARVKA